MATCRTAPEPAEPRESWVHFHVCFDFDPRPNALLVGARWLGEFAYVSKSGVYPGSRVGWRLPESLFVRGGLVELAFKEMNAANLDLRPWDQIGWTWTAVYNATTQDGQPHLQPAD